MLNVTILFALLALLALFVSWYRNERSFLSIAVLLLTIAVLTTVLR